jgi:ArsR family transcriptional regulator, virulence genes transcriptional regulator
MYSCIHRLMGIHENMKPPTPGELRPLFRMHAELCKALANEHRLAILYALSQGERCVGDLAGALDIPLHKVSQHLRILKERMLVEPRKEGQTVYYSITNPGFIEGCTTIRQALVEQYQAQGRTLLAAEVLDALQQLSPSSHSG